MKQGDKVMKTDNKPAKDKHSGRRKIYSPPRVLSSEQLEAAAGTCQPATPPLGKLQNQQCAPPFGS